MQANPYQPRVTSDQANAIAEPDSEDVLTEEQAAAMLGVTSYTLGESRKRREERDDPSLAPPHRRVGKVIRYSRAAVLAWLAGGV